MLVDALDPVPAVLHDSGLDLLAINRMGRVLLDDFDAMPVRERNLARWMFLNPRSRIVYPDWEDTAGKMVAILRGAAAKAPHVVELVGELNARSDDFARYWKEYRIYRPTNGTKRFFHEAVGIVTVHHEAMTPATDPDLSLLIYTAATGSRSETSLEELARWARVDSQ
jgi:hypothetical protein